LIADARERNKNDLLSARPHPTTWRFA